MKYKVGDKVRIKSLDWYNKNKDEIGQVDCGSICFISSMVAFCEQIVTISSVRTSLEVYRIKEDGGTFNWTDEMIERLVERNGKTYPYKIGDRVILKGSNRCATITDLKYNSWGNLSYYIKIDNDKDISIDYPTNLLLPYDNKVEGLVELDNTNKTMKQTIEIEVPEGKKAIWKDGKVVFEDIKPELPKSWEEFCEKYSLVSEECYIQDDSEIVIAHIFDRDACEDRNLLPSKEAAEVHLALMQLHQLRDCYRQGWMPDWNNVNQNKYCIEKHGTPSLEINWYKSYVHFLAFQTEEIAKEFLHNFKDLIKKAGDLI